MIKLTEIEENEILEAYEKFKEWHKESAWTGPSLYFHQKTIEYFRNKREEENFSYPTLLKDIKFLEYLYATLATWGLHRMGGVHMKNFEDFKDEVNKIGDKLEEIKNINLRNLEAIKENEDLIKEDIFSSIRVTSSKNTFIIPSSKLLHHLHPDLFPPIDRKHILKYLYCTEHPTKEEKEIFIEILKEYSKFYQQNSSLIEEIKNRYNTGMETSITKIFDNIVVGLSL